MENKLYHVHSDATDNSLTLAFCTTPQYAEKAKSLLEKAGWEDIVVQESSIGLNSIEINGEKYDLETVCAEEDEPKYVICIEDFVEDDTVYWIKGQRYQVLGRDDDLEGYRIEHEYGEGIIYDDDFDEYFVWENEQNSN